MMSVDDLQADADELNTFVASAKRPKIRALLRSELEKTLQHISRINSEKIETAVTPKGNIKNPLRNLKELTTYAWDQSDKFMKIYLTDLIGVKELSKENISCEFTARSLKLRVTNLNNKDYALSIVGLKEDITPEESFYKTKTDTLLLMLKKKQENLTWPYVTEKESILKEKREKERESKKDKYKDDPSAGLMGMLKDMYDDGDDEMKRTIAKAMAESQNKKNKGVDDFDMPKTEFNNEIDDL